MSRAVPHHFRKLVAALLPHTIELCRKVVGNSVGTGSLRQLVPGTGRCIRSLQSAGPFPGKAERPRRACELENRWWQGPPPAERFLQESGHGQHHVFLPRTADDLHANWQAEVGSSGANHRRREARQIVWKRVGRIDNRDCRVERGNIRTHWAENYVVILHEGQQRLLEGITLRTCRGLLGVGPFRQVRQITYQLRRVAQACSGGLEKS